MAKSKPTTVNLAFIVSTHSSIVNSPIASKSPGILKSSSRTGWSVQNPVASKSLGILKGTCQNDWTSTGKIGAREFNQDAASSSQGWQKDALLDGGTGKLVATEKDQEHLNYPEDFVGTGKFVAPGYQGYPGNPGTPGDSEAEGSRSLGRQDQMFFGNTLSQRCGSVRRRTNGIRVDKFHRIHYIGNARRDSTDDDGINV